MRGLERGFDFFKGGFLTGLKRAFNGFVKGFKAVFELFEKGVGFLASERDFELEFFGGFERGFESGAPGFFSAGSVGQLPVW